MRWGSLLLIFLAAGCSMSASHSLGAAVTVAPTPIYMAMKQQETVTVRGTMIEKCPTAACWFRLKDESRVLRVDVKEAGFTVQDIPLNATVTATGRIRRENGDSYLAATGLRY